MDGIIIINKPKNCTSHDIVRKAKKILNEKVGHTGTLDPNATGVLPLLIGKGTQISKYIINHDKVYEAVLQLGTKTDTADVEGKIIEEKTVTERALEKENIEKVLEELTGEQEQIPPMYSAIKINGKKLYEYARAGKFDVEIPSRKVNIYDVEFIEGSDYYKDNKFYFSINISCGKGTYVRTIATDIGKKLNLPSTMSKLTRTRSGKIELDNCLTLSEVEQLLEKNKLEEKLLKKEYALEEYQFVEIPKFRAQQVINGLRFRKNQFLDYDFTDGIVFTYENEAIAIYYLKNPDDELLYVKTTFPKIIE